MALNFYPRPSSYRKSNKGQTYWKYARFQLSKYLPWRDHINTIININETTQDFTVLFIFIQKKHNISKYFTQTSQQIKDLWVKKWQEFLNSPAKQLLPRFEHDERQAFYNACLLVNEKNTDNTLPILPCEFKADMDKHLAAELNIESSENIIKWKPIVPCKYTTQQRKTFTEWIKSEKALYSKSDLDLPIYDIKTLNKKQRFAYSIVADHYHNNSEKPLYLGIYGRPGTGKSRVIHCLRHLLQDSCRIGAFTGSAGNNAAGQTLHSLLKIQVGRKKKIFTGQQLFEQQEKWKNVKYLIIDEISLISQELLATIDHNLRLFKTNHEDAPFGS